MLTIYGKRYAESESEMVASLFDPSGTAHGVAKRRKDGLYIHDGAGNLRAFIRRDGLGPVSAVKEGKRTRYMCALADSDAAWMGEPSIYSAKVEEGRRVARECYG